MPTERTVAGQAIKVPPVRYDDRGHAIPPTEAERQARSEALRRGLAELASIPDDPAESDEEFWRAIDAARPERPLFQRYYES
jgi:hypothetical protein